MPIAYSKWSPFCQRRSKWSCWVGFRMFQDLPHLHKSHDPNAWFNTGIKGWSPPQLQGILTTPHFHEKILESMSFTPGFLGKIDQLLLVSLGKTWEFSRDESQLCWFNLEFFQTSVLWFPIIPTTLLICFGKKCEQHPLPAREIIRRREDSIHGTRPDTSWLSMGTRVKQPLVNNGEV